MSEICLNRERRTKKSFKLVKISFIKLKIIISKHLNLIFLQYQQRTFDVFSQKLKTFKFVRFTQRKQFFFSKKFHDINRTIE